MPELSGRRVVLRDVAPGDAERLMAIHRTPEVAAWWGLPREGFPLEPDDPGTTNLTILLDGSVAGFIQTYEEREPDFRYATIDLFLAPEHHRQGLGTDAIETLVRHLVDGRGHHRITIDPSVENRAAIRCYERAGFRPVGVLRSYWLDSAGVWRDSLFMERLEGGGPATGTIALAERGALHAFSFEDLLRFHGGGSPGGVAIAYKALERGLPLLGEPVERRELRIATAFAGAGARDGFEAAARAVSDGRYEVEPALARPELGPERERFVFALEHRGRRVTLVLREGYVTGELIGLARRDGRTPAQDARLEVLKAELADRVMAAAAADVFDA